jgi:hypothetical protein
MAGTPANASLWANADVYISADLNATNPATAAAAFNASWSLVGLLDGDDGFTETRDVDTKDLFAWGGILVRTSRRNFKLTKTFSVLEDNTVTRSLIWPGSTATQLIVPTPGFVKIAFETREGGKVRRMISKYRAMVEVDGDITDNEVDLTKVTLVATIYPDANGVLFDLLGAPTITSIALTPLTLAISTAKPIDKVLATATYSDATTADVSALAMWSSTDASKATVVGGYVTKVAVGTASISCTYGGITSTAPCVVTVA